MICPDGSPAEKPLLLLVDDLPTNLHLLSEALRDEYRIKTATNGKTALELAARADSPKLILLDVMMPGMDGIEVFRRLRNSQQTCDIPVVFVTADTSEQTQLDSLELGADDFLTKPVLTSILKSRVKNLLQRKEQEQQLRLAAHVFNHSGEAILITDRTNKIIRVNSAFCRLTGYQPEDVLGQDPKILSSGTTSPEIYHEMWRAIRTAGLWQGELWDRRKNGEVYPKLLTISVVTGYRGEIDYYIGSFTDISAQKEVEDRIRHQANHDPLTGLPNRLQVQATLEHMIAVARREQSELAVLFLDLDRFKQVNDTLGHSVGDQLLIQVADRLQETVRESDLVARLGGDEFLIILAKHEVRRGALKVADKLLARLSEAYSIDEHRVVTTPSIGISIFPQPADSLDDLLKQADSAMYQAKEAGRGRYYLYEETDSDSTTPD